MDKTIRIGKDDRSPVRSILNPSLYCGLCEVGRKHSEIACDNAEFPTLPSFLDVIDKMAADSERLLAVWKRWAARNSIHIATDIISYPAKYGSADIMTRPDFERYFGRIAYIMSRPNRSVVELTPDMEILKGENK